MAEPLSDRRGLPADWWKNAGLPECDHEWEYMERKPGETYTGYCERCTKCGEIVQIVQ